MIPFLKRLPFFLLNEKKKKKKLSRSLSFHHYHETIPLSDTCNFIFVKFTRLERASLATFEGIEEESAVAAREAYTLASELSRSNERARIMQLASVSWCQPTPTLDKPYQPLDVLAAEKRSA